MRELLAEALSEAGHTVDTADHGANALRLFEQQPYDLIVSDLQMPQLDGPKLYEAVHRLGLAAAPRFIFITGEDEAPGYARFLADTKAPVVTKPFKLKEFNQMLAGMFPPE